MVDPELVLQLRRRAYDGLSCQEAGRVGQGISDDEQLAFAAQQGRAIVTFNVRDFVPLDAKWKAAGRRHTGIIVVATSLPLRRLNRCVARHLDTVPPAVQDDTLLWLDTSPFS